MTDFYRLNEKGGVEYLRTLKQSAIARCPHFIMDAVHYRDDESCRCDDPNHTEMRDWGYTWDSEEGRWA